MVISKRIENEKIPNMRDLGGMVGADGKKIRSGLQGFRMFANFQGQVQPVSEGDP